jgi:hypothetical protein
VNAVCNGESLSKHLDKDKKKVPFLASLQGEIQVFAKYLATLPEHAELYKWTMDNKKSIMSFASKIIQREEATALIKIDEYSNSEFHYSMEIPNNGYYDISWSVNKGYAFLRSLDYSNYSIFPVPRIQISGNDFEIIDYKTGKKGNSLNFLTNDTAKNSIIVTLLGQFDEVLILILNKMKI